MSTKRSTKSFGTETRSILEHVHILGRQIGMENPTQLSSSPSTASQPSEYELVRYDPKLHDQTPSVKAQILEGARASASSSDNMEMEMWLDASRLCSVCSTQGISLVKAYSDPKVDVQVVRLVSVLNKSLAHPLFDSRIFRSRFSQPIYRPWLYLISQFVEVWICQQWQLDNTLFVMGTLVAGPVIPEWFIRTGDPLPIVIRNGDTGVPIQVKHTRCVYTVIGRHASFAQTLLLWLYLTECSAHRSVKHVLLCNPSGHFNQSDVPVKPAEYLHTTLNNIQLSVLSREYPEERFFPTYRLQEMLDAHARPGYRVSSEKADFDRQGRPVVSPPSLIPGGGAHSSNTLPVSLHPIPQEIAYGRT